MNHVLELARRHRKIAALWVVAALFLGAAAAVAFVDRAAKNTDAAEREATDFATTILADLLSYDPTLDKEEIDRRLSHLDGDLKGEYQELATTQLLPAVAANYSASASVQASAPMRRDDRDDTVEVLAFVTVQIQEGSKTTASSSRLLVTVVRTDDEWKIRSMEDV